MYIREQKYQQNSTPPPNYDGTFFRNGGEEVKHEIISLPPPAIGQDEPVDDKAIPVSTPPPKTETVTSDHPPKSKPLGFLSSLIPSGLYVGDSFGFEEMLLIALMFLLSQSENDEEILIILALLLFIR